MTLLAGVIAPHPPILIPAIGDAQLEVVSATIEALNKVDSIVSGMAPDTFIFISPHSQLVPDRFAINNQPHMVGSFKQFGVDDVKVDIENDLDTVDMIINAGRHSGLPIFALEDQESSEIDWGVSVPYSYFGNGKSIVSMSISTLTLAEHFRLGRCIAEAIADLKKNFVFVASGDLSHRLTPDAPYGYSVQGKKFDQLVQDILLSGQLKDFLVIDKNLIQSAGECGLRSFATLAGLFSDQQVKSKILSYEGPFGIGYLVAVISPENDSNV